MEIEKSDDVNKESGDYDGSDGFLCKDVCSITVMVFEKVPENEEVAEVTGNDWL